MKKTLFFIFAFLFAAGVVMAKDAKPAAQEGNKVPAKAGTFKPNREEMIKDYKQMKALVSAYESAKTAKEKAAAEEAVKQKVSQNYDRHLAFMQERIKESEERIAAVQKKLEDDKKAEVKTKKVEEITKKILSGEKPMLFAPPPDWRGAGAQGGCQCGKHFAGKNVPEAQQGQDKEMLPPPPPQGNEPNDLPEAE